jgi:hypothetical protein
MDPATPFHQTRSREAPFQFLVVNVDPRNAMTTPSQVSTKAVCRTPGTCRQTTGRRHAGVSLYQSRHETKKLRDSLRVHRRGRDCERACVTPLKTSR